MDLIFEQDELNLLKVNPNWTAEVLLSQKGIFFLKDITDLLDLDSLAVIKRARSFENDGLSSWEHMGVRKIWNHWGVRMTVFAPFYRDFLRKPYRTVEKHWTQEDLLKEDGIFLLTEVCNLIPFTSYQIRYQASKEHNSRKSLGIWKDPELNRFMVEMSTFSNWLSRFMANSAQELLVS